MLIRLILLSLAVVSITVSRRVIGSIILRLRLLVLLVDEESEVTVYKKVGGSICNGCDLNLKHSGAKSPGG